MIPAYIIDNGNKQQEIGEGIQLEIPDYTLEYEEYLRQKKNKEEDTAQETVIIIDIY